MEELIVKLAAKEADLIEKSSEIKSLESRLQELRETAKKPLTLKPQEKLRSPDKSSESQELHLSATSTNEYVKQINQLKLQLEQAKVDQFCKESSQYRGLMQEVRGAQRSYRPKRAT